MRDVLTREAKNQSLQSNLVSPRWSFSDQSFVFSFIGSSFSFSCFFSRSVSDSILLSLNFIFKDKYSFSFYFLSLSSSKLYNTDCPTLLRQENTSTQSTLCIEIGNHRKREEKQLNSFIRKSSQYKSPISLTSFFLCSPLPFPLLSFLPPDCFNWKEREKKGNK